MLSWISTWNHGLKVRNQFGCDSEHSSVVTILSMKTKAMKDINATFMLG